MPPAVRTERQQKAGELHASSKIMEVLLDKLQVDLSYQRQPSHDLVDKIANDWDVVASELILVSDRGPREGKRVAGGLFVVNGQHRTIAAKQLGMDTIWARVINLRKEPHPAMVEAAFRLKTNVRLGDRPLERFKAQLAAGDEESKQIVKIVKKYGTEINEIMNAEVGINCISTVEALYRYDEGSLLDDTLSIMQEVYGSVRGPYATSSIFKGIAWFVEAHSEGADRGRLVSKLKGIQVVALHARARTHASIMGGTLWINVYRTILELYNEKLTSKRLEFTTKGSQALSKSSGGFTSSTGGE